MIPVALTLKGFLSFRDEQRLDFDRDQVWLLSGPNGSGKSTVFDAILFALYAGHRAGKADLHELINKDCGRATVRFDFILGDRQYRAERIADRTTDKKTGRPGYAASQQLYEWEDARWKPIAETHRQGDFQEWVREHVGLSFDAFTSSALLMQGRADVLVAQDAEAARRRFEVLARIVGLDFYERLHRQADDRRKKHEKRAGELKAQLEVIAPVDTEQLDALTAQESACAAQVAAVEQQIAHLHACQAAATRWIELQGQRTSKHAELDAAVRIAGDAAVIERDAARWQELQAGLPALDRLVEQQKLVATAEANVVRLRGQRDALECRAAAAATALQQARRAQADLASAQADNESERLRHTAAKQELALALAPLRRLHQHRAAARRAEVSAESTAAELRRAEAALERHAAELAPLALEVQAAGQACRDAERTLTTAQTRWHDFEEQARRFATVADAQVCSYCGQALSAEHAEQERTRIAREQSERKRARQSAQQLAAAAQLEETNRQARQDVAEHALAAARLHVESLGRASTRAADALQMHRQAISEAGADLPAPYRSAAQADAGFPSEADLARLTAELKEHEVRLEELHRSAMQRGQALTRLRQQHEHAERDAAGIAAEMRHVETALAQQTERAALGRQQLDRARGALPAAWQTDPARWTEASVRQCSAELHRLTAADAAGQLERLRAAQAAQAPLRRLLDQIDSALNEVPAEARRDPTELDGQLRTARLRDNALRTEFSDVQATRRQLAERQARREKLLADYHAADRQRHLSARLAELLSRRHLQRHLLRQAEVGIVENTNRVLDRITAGQLSVRLLPETDAENRALQLEAYKAAPGQSFGLSFLSGSERFRVAIGLALGIGQYASRQHRAIESVIIDEGFGCLDRDNRRTMIDELEHLRGQLRCIVLVSHQEEFADAFPEGYRFHVADGTSRVERAE